MYSSIKSVRDCVLEKISDHAEVFVHAVILSSCNVFGSCFWSGESSRPVEGL